MNEFTFKRVNLSVLSLNLLLNAFLFLGYTGEYLKGNKTLGYTLVFLALLTVPSIVSFIYYRRHPAGDKLKYLTLFGYFFIYAFALFSAPRVLVFVYMFPIIAMYLLYFDLGLIVKASIAALALNILRIFYAVLIWKQTTADMTTDFTIQIAAVILYGVAISICTNLSNKLNKEKIEGIELEKNKQYELVYDIVNTASILENNSKQVYANLEDFINSANTITKAVKEISQGVSRNTMDIQEQTGLTYQIQKVIDEAFKLSTVMGERTDEVNNTVSQGFGMIRNLNDKTAIMQAETDNVYKSMVNLSEKSKEIQNIVEIIKSVSEQTNLLSLNAAIEAARAGDAGRGFAVVADEVRKLAERSKLSAESIRHIIESLLANTDNSVEAVQKLENASREQNELISDTFDVFKLIGGKVGEVSKKVVDVNSKINDIVNANAKIIEKANDILGVSEEISANIQEASAMSDENVKQADSSKQLLKELLEASDALKKNGSTSS